ncbi:DUF1456 family protein [Thalassotalea marina]|uniref:DUF1456 family protein n=1 Tax=Thalassotalea marina TaxID=1673741 RepID=A0A919BM00_9GAMM|nr:DUF1456 family protein [Thalassotalea marina]GHF97972.1 hypothetical protein GCM10017161_27920 [Thalassotalea marina]
MTNNDVLRRLRYTFSLKDQKVKDIFALANRQVTLEQITAWLKKDDEPEMVPLADIELASFLNGFIVEKRGRGDKAMPAPEKELTKNLILKKLKIALELQTDDIIALLASVDVKLGNGEITAFFRNPDHKNYRHCKAQILRNFLMALQLKHSKPAAKAKAKQGNTKQSNAKPKANKKPPTPKKLYVNPYAKAEEKLEDAKESKRNVLSLKK